uniref:Fibronectin type III domain containing 7a n=1 Tax=Xiphophorus couchianus TaxID=32473 RepID=A0A3B5LFU1_9TELE
TLSVFTVTSKSMTVQWSVHSGASSYKITATPKNSPARPVFAQFSGNTVMGSVNSLSPSTVYTMQLEAMDPDVPSIDQAYSKNSDSITVEFAEVSGATSYILRAESTTGDFFFETPTAKSPGTVVGLQPYTDYILSVMSVNSGGRSQPSYPIKARTVIAPKLNTSSPSNDSILVTWPPVEHAIRYTLIMIQEGSSTRLILNTTDTTVTFDKLEPGVSYCIKGMAWDAEGRTGDDLTVCQITIAVYWMTVQGANSYLVLASNGQNCNTSDSYCFISPQECGQNHSITVTAYNDAGPSSPSQSVGYITPCPPENIWVEEPIAGNCSVVWEKVPLVEYYVAFIKRDDGTEKSCNTTKTTCQFFCMCGYTYLTSVFPYNQAGTSLFADVRNYTTPCCPQDVSVKLVSTETLEVMWSPVKGAELYETTAAQTNNVLHCNDTSPVCALSDLTCNSLYSVTVTPCSELRGCNYTCTPYKQETPCAPEILNMTQTTNSTYKVLISTPNSPNTNYTISATGRYDKYTCQSRNNFCELTQLSCGTIYEVTAVASTAVGKSLPGYSKTLE